MFLIADPTASCEKKLWAAVLIQAVEDRLHPKFTESYHSGKRYVDAAQQWFERSEDGIGSFNWICFVLDLDPEKILTGINEQGFEIKNGNTEKLSIAIKEFRAIHKMSQREFAKQINLDQTLISNLERGKISKCGFAEDIWDFINNGGEHGPGDIAYQ